MVRSAQCFGVPAQPAACPSALAMSSNQLTHMAATKLASAVDTSIFCARIADWLHLPDRLRPAGAQPCSHRSTLLPFADLPRRQRCCHCDADNAAVKYHPRVDLVLANDQSFKEVLFTGAHHVDHDSCQTVCLGTTETVAGCRLPQLPDHLSGI